MQVPVLIRCGKGEYPNTKGEKSKCRRPEITSDKQDLRGELKILDNGLEASSQNPFWGMRDFLGLLQVVVDPKFGMLGGDDGFDLIH